MFKKVPIGIIIFITAVLCIFLLTTPIFAQEENTFSDSFDEPLGESYEHSQDVLVSEGVLRINPGNVVFKTGYWPNPSVSFKLRASQPVNVLFHYHSTDEGAYSLNIISEGENSEAILTMDKSGEGTELGTQILSDFKTDDWNMIEVSFDGSQHKVTINGQSVFEVEDTEQLNSGAVGFVVPGENPVEIDDLVIRSEGTSAQEGGVPTEEGLREEVAEEGMTESETAAAPEDQAETIQTQDTTWKDLLESIFISGASLPDMKTFLVNLALSAVFAYILGIVYIYWGASLSNRRKFAANFILLTVTTTFIILVVRSSVALSLGLVGALSIVRFRAAIKEPEELAYLFLAIGLGIGLGDNQRLITTIAFAVAIVILGLMKLFRRSRADANMHLNIVTFPPSGISLNKVQETLKPFCPKIKLLRFDENDKLLEMSFIVEFRKIEDLDLARDALQKLSDKIDITFLDNKGVW
jgi:hypothetical protein